MDQSKGFAAGRSGRRIACALLLLLSQALLFWTTTTSQHAQNMSGAGGQQQGSAKTSYASTGVEKRIAPLVNSETAEGSRVTIISDAPLNDYRAYQNGNLFSVLIPRASVVAQQESLRGRTFEGTKVERHSDDLVISFYLQAGALARVSQRFNRLYLTFAAPAQLSTSAEQQESSVAQAERVSASTAGINALSQPTPTPTPSPASTAENAAASTPAPASSTSIKTSGGRTLVLPPEKAGPVRIARFEKPPVIDGKLDDEVWKQATVFKDFYQFKPGDNIAPSQPTEAFIGYDARTLYIAFLAHDEPGKVRATVPKRDSIFDDDFIGVFLDTFNDKRKAYELLFNPLGVQADAIYTENSGEDFSVDIVMESKGTVTQDGYIVEVAIPFKSLRYEAGKGKLWGIHLLRTIKRLNNEQDSWMPISRDVSGTLVQAGHITGLEGVSTERTLELIPSLTLSETGKRMRAVPPSPFPNSARVIDTGRFVNKPFDFDFGLTAKYTLTPTVILDFAYNPDFAQVEADQTVITANQRFPIFFEEKRPFFLEGKDIFDTRNTIVHTRAIIDPDYAAKLTGKRGRNTFGLLLASDNAPGNFSEEEREILRRNPAELSQDELADQARIARFVDKNAYIGILRFKRDVGAESSLGMFATSYNFIEQHNQLVGFDGRFKLNPQTVTSFEVIGTTSRNFFRDANLDQNLYRTGNGFAYSYRYEVNKRHYGWNYDARGRTQDYRADVGFTNRVNTNRHGLFMYYDSEPKPKATLISWGINSNPYINFDWQGRSQNAGQGVSLSLRFKHQTYAEFGVNRDYERLLEEEFGPKRTANRQGAFFGPSSERSNWQTGGYIYSETTLSKQYSGSIFIRQNRGVFDFDFGAGPNFPRVSPAALLAAEAERQGLCDVEPAVCNAPLDPGPANSFNLELGFNYQPTNALRATFNYTKARLTRQDNGLLVFDDNIYVLRTTYQFTRFMFARARLDYETLSANVRGQFLFGWTPNPGTAFYIGYNDDLNRNGFNPFNGNLEPGLRRNGRTFFIKLSYLYRRSFE
ncbi:MAG TPA: sugar-binding protein [Pyrinomonadaceae bacterium]|jgi:hypothetical protein